MIAVNTNKCPRCEHQAILRPRHFSDQATASLVALGDMDKKVVGHPICDDCHEELRDALIDHQRVAAEKEVAAGRVRNRRAG
jgi:hypothetical protein